MITSLTLQNFKCFEDVKVPLSNLTLLTGANGMGKSSVIQALLLLRQSFIAGFLNSKGLLLNGPLTSLGAADDVVFEDATKDGMLGFILETDSGTVGRWSFGYEKGRDIQPVVSKPSEGTDLFSESLFQCNFQYLQAERVGPRSSFMISNHEDRQYCEIGKSGEFSAFFMGQKERLNIPILGLKHPLTEIVELREQTEAWLSEITPGTRVHVTEHSNMDLVNLEFSFVRKGLTSRKYRAANVGFGLTYSFPIFVSTLASCKGAMILVENPEAHLHPKGQAMMGRFLSTAAQHGIQVIIETHSDHVLNGIRVAVKAGEILPENAAVHFFARDEDEIRAKLCSPQIDKNGRLNYWPTDFFDETEKSLSQLL